MTKKIPPALDHELFRQTVGDVRAVKNDKIPPVSDIRPKPYPKPQFKPTEDRLDESIAYELETLGVEDSLNFSVPGVQKQVLTKMRNGHFGIDAEIDLHGLTVEAAKPQLMAFIKHTINEGCRCVLIIHGKGYRSHANLPVLKNQLNLWLRQHQDVLAFCSAKPKHGGAGAVLALLRVAEKYAKKD